MIGVLDDLIRALRHHEQKPPGQYRLIRPRFRHLHDADRWLGHRDVTTGTTWRCAATRDYALIAWVRLRKLHHVAWLERGGEDRG